MDNIFMLSFLTIMVMSFARDRMKLKQAGNGVKMIYGLFTFLSLTFFITKYLHWSIPMPSRFFIHSVSPWLGRLIGV
ncbi:hypothetical protein [Paenibacillus sp. N3.4]|uniref:hypothetical protein n=1 Tax=Paenibacillus sp. N3.4 TaxID=2603222 RepID=UPI0011C93BEA|nr:hypothetical protein [Paenibacillus sp. N3.4]TXK76361.1 hypothetical protein FU659_25905 [Paenibacillus sp. N3.4]